MELNIFSKDNEKRNKTTNRLHLTIDNVDVSIVNALRRVITSNINILVFRGFPEKENQIKIHKNTTKFNNEYLKHRLSCIPIMNNDETTFSTFCNMYEVELNETNDTLEKKYITTQHLKIIDKTTKKVIDDNTDKYFPSDPITGDHIIICILYPNQNKNEENESLHFNANFDQGTAQENSCWNVAHHCAYENVQDESLVKEKSMQITDKMKQMDFLLLDAQRLFIKNRFKLSVESIGIYTNEVLIQKACKYILKRLGQINNYFMDTTTIQNKYEYNEKVYDGTLSKEERVNINEVYCTLYKDDLFYVFELKEDDYTIGKMIEKYYLYMYDDVVKFVGFKKEHPTQKKAFIYIQYDEEKVSSNNIIYEHFDNLIQFLTRQFTTIQNDFMTK